MGGWGVSGGDFYPPNGGFGGPSPQPWSRPVSLDVSGVNLWTSKLGPIKTRVSTTETVFYISESSNFSYNEAKNFCRSVGLKLAQIHTQKENSELFKWFNQLGWDSQFFNSHREFIENGKAWIGAEMAGKSNDWEWADGNPICDEIHSNWHKSEPVEDRVGIDLMMYSGKWGTVEKDTKWAALCEDRCRF